MEMVQLQHQAACFCLLMLMRGGGTHLLKPWHQSQLRTLEAWQHWSLWLTENPQLRHWAACSDLLMLVRGQITSLLKSWHSLQL